MGDEMAADLAIAAAFVNAERARDGDRDEQSLDAAVQAFRRSLERDGWAVAQALTPERLLDAMTKAWPTHAEGVGSTDPTFMNVSWRILDPTLPLPALAADLLAALVSTEEPRHE